jgi:serine phosphatase RsbU (regulator of sigma subunit)
VKLLIGTSFRTRLLIGLVLLSAAVSAFAATLLFLAYEETQREQAQAWMQATIVQAAATIDLDAVRAASAGTDDDEVARARDELRQSLSRARDATVRELDAALGQPIAERTIVNLAVMVRTDDPGQARVIASLDSDEVGHLHDMSGSAVRTTGWETLSVEETPGPDADEPVVRAYVPIRDRAGEPVAVMRLDADQRYFDALITEAVVAAILIFVIAMTFSMLFTATFSRQMARPVETLVRGMDAVAAGNLSVRVPAPGTLNEMDRLSKHFNTMVGDLRDRERMQRDVGTATEVQVRLLPREQPVLEGYEIHGGTKYCSEAGGDYFDYLQMSPSSSERDQQGERLGIIVADVAGHGLGSALLMTAIRAVLRSAILDRGADLVDAVSSVNRQMLHDEGGGAFVTMFAGVLDRERHAIAWLSAGHDPALVYRRSTGSIMFLEATGVPLGVIEADAVAGTTIQLDPGDIIVIGTDGVSQARDATGAFYGFDRMASLVRDLADASAEEIWRRLFKDVSRFEDAPSNDDDMTAVVIKRMTRPGG